MTDQSGVVNGQQQNTPPTWTFTMTVQEWLTIRSGLLELPGKIGIPVLSKLEQFMQQAQNAAYTTQQEQMKGIVQ